MDSEHGTCRSNSNEAVLVQLPEGMGACDEAFGVSLGETALSADLDGSRKYSNENFKGRSGEGFHVNSSWTWVSRSYETGMLRLRRLCLVSRKEKGLIFPNQDVRTVWQRKRIR